MSDKIDFSNGSDTGEANSDSIQPYEDGQPANATTFNRPSENLRARTETLRGHANATRMLSDLDRAMLFTLSGANGITWGGHVAGGGSGEVVLGASTSLRLVPFMTPGAARSRFFENTGTVFPGLLARLEVVDGSNTLQIVSDKQVWQGGNQITVAVTDVPSSGTIAVNVNGSTPTDPSVQPGVDDIVVTYDSVAGHTITAVLTAINGDPTASALITVTQTAGTGTDPMFDIAATALTAGLDGVYHEITQANLAAFFAASSDNALREGDTLAIWYDTTLLRRQSTEESSNAIIPAASLVNLTREPEKAENCIPIAKVIGDELVLANNQALLKAATVTTLNSGSGLRTDLAKALSAAPAAGANTYGSEIIGVNSGALTNSATAVGSASLQQVLVDLDTAISSNTSDISSNDTDISNLQDDAILTTTTLWDVDDSGDPGSDAQLVQLRDPSTLAQERYKRYNFPNADGSTFYSFAASASSLIDVDGSYVHVWDGTNYRQIEIETTSELFTDALANIIDLSSNGSYTALIQSSTDNLIIYESGNGTPVQTIAVGTLGPGSGTVLKVAMRADNYAWVLFHEEIAPSDFRWYARSYNAATGAVVDTLELAAGTAAGDYDVQGFDAAPNIVGMVAEDGVVGGDPVTLFLQRYNYTTSSWSASTHDVGDAISATICARLIFMEENILIAGQDLAVPTDVNSVGLDNNVILLSRQSPDLGVRGTGELTTRASNGCIVHDIYADGDRIYAVLEDDSTGDERTIAVLDNRLDLVSMIDAGVNIIRAVSDGQYFWTLDASGNLVQHVNDVTGAWYRFDDAGREPGWTHHIKLGHGK